MKVMKRSLAMLCGKKAPEISVPDVFAPLSSFLYQHFCSNGYSKMWKS